MSTAPKIEIARANGLLVLCEAIRHRAKRCIHPYLEPAVSPADVSTRMAAICPNTLKAAWVLADSTGS